MVEKKSYKTLLEKIQRYSWECNDEEEAQKVVEKHFNEYMNILTNNDPAILTEHEKKEFKELVIEYFRIYKRAKEEEDEIGELKNYVEYIDAMTTSELLEEDNGLPNYIRDPNDKMYYLGEQQSKYLAHIRDRGMMQMELESAEGDLRKFVYKMYKKIYPRRESYSVDDYEIPDIEEFTDIHIVHQRGAVNINNDNEAIAYRNSLLYRYEYLQKELEWHQKNNMEYNARAIKDIKDDMDRLWSKLELERIKNPRVYKTKPKYIKIIK